MQRVVLVCQRQLSYLSEEWELEIFQTAEVTFNVTQGHWYCCHSIGHIRFPIGLPLQQVRSFTHSKDMFMAPKSVKWVM